MNQKYLHYAYLFVKEEIQKLEKSINDESGTIVKQLLEKRREELLHDLAEIEKLQE